MSERDRVADLMMERERTEQHEADPRVDTSYTGQIATLKARIRALEGALEDATKLLREIDRHGVLSMATQKGAGEFIRKLDAARALTEGER